MTWEFSSWITDRMNGAVFIWPGFGSGADYRSGSLWEQELLPHCTETDQTAPRGIHCWPETVNDVESSSIIAYLRKPKNHCAAGVREETDVKGAALHTPRWVKKEREEVHWAWKQRFPKVCGEENGKAGCAPAAARGAQWSTNPSCRPPWIPY